MPAQLPSDVPSPCTAVCRIDPVSGWCEGCQRTLQEIAGWGSMPPARKREVLAAIELRRRVIGRRPSR